MRISRCMFSLLILSTGISCTVTRNYNPGRKYSPAELQSDYKLLRKILEEKHPSLYWYTPPAVMNNVMDAGLSQLKDSMTEQAFGWHVLAPVLAQIHCGHTSLMMSKEWQSFARHKNIPSFPLFVKVWNDSMMVVADMNRDGAVPRGSFIKSINGIPQTKIVRDLFQFMPMDGYGYNLNFIKLSASFPFYFRNVFGVLPFYYIAYTDSNNVAFTAMIPWWVNEKDTTEVNKPFKKKAPEERKSAEEKRKYYRSMKVKDTIAIMDVNAFTKGSLNNFFRRSFRKLRKEKIKHLIIDLRVNGGGDINKAVALARYITDKPFKIADSAFSVSKNFNPYSGYISKSFWNNIGLVFFSKKKEDGKYHFGYWERHFFKPKKKNHFDGNVYVLTNGLTFSAASLFCSLVREEENVMLVGEETGGGWYGNSGILIPTITLPNTRLRVRLPFFRLVQYRHPPFKGSGVVPEWYIGPDWRDVLKNEDTKMKAVLDAISRQDKFLER